MCLIYILARAGDLSLTKQFTNKSSYQWLLNYMNLLFIAKFQFNGHGWSWKYYIYQQGHRFFSFNVSLQHQWRKILALLSYRLNKFRKDGFTCG